MRKILKNAITNPLISGSAIMVLGSNSINFLNYLYHLIMGRMLGPSFYGELASLISLMGLLGIIPAAVSLVIIKYVSSAKDKKEVAILASWLKTKILQASLIFFVFIIIASPFIASFLHINKLSYLFLIGVIFLFSIQALVNRSILQGLLKFKVMVISVLVENGTKLVISVALVYLGFRVGGAMVAFVLSTLLGWYIANSYIRFGFKTNSTNLWDPKPMILFAIPVLVQSFAITSLYSSDVLLVKHFFSSHEAGIYASLSTLGKIIFFGAGPIGSVMFPLVSQRQARKQNYRKIFTLSFFGTGFSALGVLLIYWLFPEYAIRLLYGSAYLEASPLLVWFGIFISLFTLSALLINYGLSLGKTSIVVFPSLAALIQIILIWFFHNTIFTVILISIFVTALLLVFLLIYFIYSKDGNTVNIDNRPGI